jgi:hypothetical protein
VWVRLVGLGRADACANVGRRLRSLRLAVKRGGKGRWWGTCHGTISVVVAGIGIWITPPQVQAHLLVLFKAGIPRTSTVGEPGAHGAGITGTQGCGVKTPEAADVAEATAGLAIELHIPNGGMFTFGT